MIITSLNNDNNNTNDAKNTNYINYWYGEEFIPIQRMLLGYYGL